MKDPILCDGCGRMIVPGQVRYALRIEVFADYEEIEISEEDLMRDDRADLAACLEEIRDADPEELQDQVYRNFDFVLCRACQSRYLENPLHPLTGAIEGSRIH